MQDPHQKLPENQDPENYSLEEMMRKLKDREHEEGELVTRDDGTVAVKIRKRKRRSHQPHKEEAKKKQKLRVVQLGLAFFGIVALAIAAACMLFYVNSSSFREETRNKIEISTAAKVDMSEFSVTPRTARAANMSFTWPEGNHLRSANISGIEAKLDPASFFQPRWGGNSVVAKSGSMIAMIAERDKPRGYHPEETGEFPFNFRSYRCEKFQMQFLTDVNKPWLVFDQTEAAMSKTLTGSQLRLVGGDVRLDGFNPMILDRASILFENGEMKTERLSLLTKSSADGRMILSNKIDLYSLETQTLDLKLEEFPLSQLMGHGMETYVTGHVDSPEESMKRYISFKVGDATSLRVHSHFTASKRDPLVLKNFSFLKVLSNEMGDQEILSGYVFKDECEGVLIRTHSETQFKNLRLISDGQLAITGNIVSNGKELSGTLRIGIGADALALSSTNPHLRKVFTEEEGRFFWTTVLLSGTPAAPLDDLENRMKLVNAEPANRGVDQAPALQPGSVDDELDGP